MDAALKLNEIARKDEAPWNRARMQADMAHHRRWCARLSLPNGGPRCKRALRGEAPVSQQTSHAVEGVRMVDIDDTPEEDDD